MCKKKKRYKLRQKFFNYGFTVFVPVFIVASVFFAVFTIKRKFDDELKTENFSVRSVSVSIKLLQDEIKKLSTYVCINSDIKKIVSSKNVEEMNANPRVWYDDAPLEAIQNLIALNGDIKTFSLYPENGVKPYLRGMDGSMSHPTIARIRTTKAYSLTQKSDSHMIWSFVPKNTRGTYEVNREDKVMLYREMVDIRNNAPLCFLAIGINVETFERICHNVIQDSSQKILVFNSLFEELCDIGKTDTELKVQIQRMLLRMQRETLDSLQFWYRGNMVSCCKLERDSSVVCKITPLNHWKSFIVSNVIMFLVLTGGSLIGLYLLLRIMSRYVTKPMLELSAAIKKVSDGDLAQQIQVNGNDELAQVAQAFNKMLRDLDSLINENYVIRLKEKENEIACLQAQINPHFLYNTLNSLYWQAIGCGNEYLGDNILTLSKLFQLVLNQGNREVPVEKEFELIGYYLEIQKMRFNHRLEYSIELDDGIKNQMLPKLILQPFVENSIVHGFASKAGECNLSLRGRKSGNLMEFRITDTGIGMTEEQIDNLLHGTKKRRGDGIGSFAIKNIIELLDLRYKDSYRFEIMSQVGMGTDIRICIPIQGENENV